jgi:molybdopterin converting factor small subunit
MINIKLTGQFQALAPEGSENGLFDAGYLDQTLGELLDSLGVEGAGVKYNVLVNNLRKTKDYKLMDGDSVIVMPLLAGG